MKKYGIAFAFFICLGAVLFAENFSATVMEVAGKVEYKLPGKNWQRAQTGDVLSAGTLIATGFKSTAILKTESAVLTVKPVTKLSLDELIKSSDGTQTQMFLMTGRVKAEVTPQAGQTANFKVKSPTATASVRGTGFEFDGQNLLVEHGSVEFLNFTGAYRSVQTGQFSSLGSDNTLGTPVPSSASSIPIALLTTGNLGIVGVENIAQGMPDYEKFPIVAGTITIY